MIALLAGVFGTGLYKYCDRDSYLAISVIGCLPGFVVPILFPCEADRGRPYSERFWVKGSTWIAIFGFYGNYFWTHYFYQLLDAKYLFDSYRFNDVPLVTFTSTFFYFTFYFSFVNVILRRVANFARGLPSLAHAIIWWSSIFTWAYGTAVFEAVSIQHFPLYTYSDRDTFLTVGSVVYGLYFIVGVPMFFALDEDYSPAESPDSHPPSRLSLWDTAVSAFAATAIVTLLLDLWRLLLGNIYELGKELTVPLPFVYQPLPPTPEPKVVAEVVVTVDACTQLAKDWARSQIAKATSLLR